MDHQKTGALIARCRNQLGLTQKALAQKLNISDRAVSKWERGAGFPDISLIEPLADALGLTVLELLHGKEEPPTPEEERSARETLNNIRPEVHENMKKTRRWIIALAVLLVLAAAALVTLISSASDLYAQDVTADVAAAVSPYAMITTQEYELMYTLYQEFLSPDDTNAGKMDEKNHDDNFGKYILSDLGLNNYSISVNTDFVNVMYTTEQYHCSLSVHKRGCLVHKTVTVFGQTYLTEDGQPTAQSSNRTLYNIQSLDNQTFRLYVRATGLAALLD